MESETFNIKIIEDYEKLIDKMNKQEPFAFAHFNDGEMRYILKQSTDTISRGCQSHSVELEEDLKRVFLLENAQFYKGIPCEICFGMMRKKSLDLLESQCQGQNQDQIVEACVFHHNYVKRRQELFAAMRKYKYQTWITNDHFNMEKIMILLQLEENEIKHYKIPSVDGYNYYKVNEIQFKNIEYRPNELVMLLCGPSGRIIAGDGIMNHPDKTFLCLGSYFDQLSNGIHHEYFSNNVMCRGCCPPPNNIENHINDS